MERPLYMFVDESGTDNTSGVLLLTVVVTEQPERARKIIGQYLDRVKRDPEQKHLSGVAKAVSLHYTSDHIEIKTRFIESILPGLEFDAYVSFIRKSEAGAVNDTVDLISRALNVLVLNRIQENHYREIHLIYEDPGESQLKRAIQQTTDQIINRVAQEKVGKKPRVQVGFADKSELGLAIPDYVSGIVRGYLQARGIEQISDGDKAMADTLERNYKRLVGKIRVLNDYTRKQFYTRQTSMLIDY